MSPPSIEVDSGCKDGSVEIKVAKLLRTRNPTARLSGLLPGSCGSVRTFPDARNDARMIQHEVEEDQTTYYRHCQPMTVFRYFKRAGTSVRRFRTRSPSLDYQ
ncbi:hypothetical protein EDD15DRAFT_2190944 [Pisolithus albus]|nr:hypothetical protein EDD15DRAFT_2190944 [Pisolithus albus]